VLALIKMKQFKNF